MALPIASIAGGLSAIAGLFGSSAKNKAAKMDAETNRKLAEEQIGIARLIQDAAQQYARQGSNITDIYGGGARYNPATGTWEYTLGGTPMALQEASDAEELNRYTIDQDIRREGLRDSEIARRTARDQAVAELGDYNRQKQGIGAVDPSATAAQLRSNRLRATNAGFDDAMRAAGTLSLRTGSSAGDAFARLGRARAGSIAQTMGDPEIDALGIADSINTGRRNNTLNSYNLFDTKGRDFYDTGFSPATYASDAMDRTERARGFDLDKFNSTTGAMGGAAAALGSAGAGQRVAQQQYMQNWNPFASAQFLSGIGKMAGGWGAK